MEKFACKLEKIFEEKFLLYKTLSLVFEQEKKYIVDMDIDSLWEITDRKNELASQIKQIRERILNLFKENKIPFNMTPENFNAVRVINGFQSSEKIKSSLKKINVKLDVIKEELAVQASENKRYTSEYLSVINGIFTTITGSENREQYTPKGMVSKDNCAKNLIRAEV